jgi:hypothetical protein
MQNAEGDGVSARSENPNDGYRSIVPELVSSMHTSRQAGRSSRWNQLSAIRRSPLILGC